MNEKALRGYVLDFLKRVYPAQVEELNIIATFYQYWTDAQIRRTLAYLADKGYVDVEEKPHPVLKRKTLKLYKLTAKGVDLSEGTIQDDGIILPEED